MGSFVIVPIDALTTNLCVYMYLYLCVYMYVCVSVSLSPAPELVCVYVFVFVCVCPSHQSRYFSLNEKELEVVATYTVAPTKKQALEQVGLFPFMCNATNSPQCST